MKEVHPSAANAYQVDMPPMDTLFVVVDRPDEVRLCGLKANRDHEDYCSCMPETPDARRCRHLWAADFYLFRRGIYPSKSIELHQNFLDGRYPELRRMERMFVTAVDPLVDLEGLAVFTLIAHSSVFKDLLDRFSSRSEIYLALRGVVDMVSLGSRISFIRLSTALKGELRF